VSAARGNDVFDIPTLYINDNEQTSLDTTHGLKARLAIVMPAILTLERRSLEQSGRQREIEPSFLKASFAFARISTEKRQIAIHGGGYTLPAYADQVRADRSVVRRRRLYGAVQGGPAPSRARVREPSLRAPEGLELSRLYWSA
jgi:hypothetical protein